MLGPRKIRLVADLPLSDHFRRERALNLRLEHPDQIVGGDRADQLEDDAAVAADDESLGHPIHSMAARPLLSKPLAANGLP